MNDEIFRRIDRHLTMMKWMLMINFALLAPDDARAVGGVGAGGGGGSEAAMSEADVMRIGPVWRR